MQSDVTLCSAFRWQYQSHWAIFLKEILMEDRSCEIDFGYWNSEPMMHNLRWLYISTWCCWKVTTKISSKLACDEWAISGDDDILDDFRLINIPRLGFDVIFLLLL